MRTITQIERNRYSADFHFGGLTDEEAASAKAEGWEGYGEWSTKLEADAWQGSKPVGDILIKKSCEHSQCGHFKCERSLRIGGIEV